MKARSILHLSLAALAAAMMMLSGCSSVRAYQKGYLADPIMSSADESLEEMRELKWVEAREGSTGGAGGAGGGCACK